MRLSLADTVQHTLPPDPGEAQAVADWAAQTRADMASAQLNSLLYVPASHPAQDGSLSKWLTDNSTVIVAGCAVLGLIVALGKR